MKGTRSTRGVAVLIVLLIVGGLAGALLGQALAPLWPILLKGPGPIGVAPFTVQLGVLNISFWATLNLNLAAVVGVFLGYLAYRKL